jgi:hypothetical protein
VQLKERFPEGAVLMEWGKRPGAAGDVPEDDVWLLNKLKDLAAKMACVPQEYKGAMDSVVCCYVTMSSTTLSETDHRLCSSLKQGMNRATLPVSAAKPQCFVSFICDLV